ncbi:MAG TPA: hypothetical protein VEG44_08165 [Candidatus Acidoferrales bacterium]|jgi:hypothetical protein|nr:hypothetical protein [Candidatus Acidoferrales bacterium]
MFGFLAPLLSCIMPLVSGTVPYLMGPANWLGVIVSANTGPLGIGTLPILGWT